MLCPECGGDRVHKTKDKSGERIKQKRSVLMVCSDCGYKFRLVKLGKEKKDES
jgi:C4-type Zn-finger protein